MGMVYEATDRRDGSRVAVKLLHPQLSVDEALRERFEREAHVAALLRSPYTVHLLGFGVVDGTYYLAMEFIDGQTVAEAMADAPLPPDQALPIAISVARALEEAEARGVVHRDIKPENIMLTSDGMMKVADFGIVRRMDTPSMTVTGGFVGTMAYGAPEQMGGAPRGHPRARGDSRRGFAASSPTAPAGTPAPSRSRGQAVAARRGRRPGGGRWRCSGSDRAGAVALRSDRGERADW